MKMIFALLSLLLLSVVPVFGAEEFVIEFHPGGEPVQMSQVKNTAPVPTFALSLPAFFVDPTSANGLTTLFAIRNRSASSVTVRIAYFDRRGLGTRTDMVTLAANQTRTFNLRDVPGLPINPNTGLIEGVVLLNTIDPITGETIINNSLGGDYFLVDTLNNFASGNAMLDAVDDFCNRWDLRYFSGGAFSGGTDLIFLVPFNSGATALNMIAMGNVYTESGTFAGTVTLSTTRAMVVFNTVDDITGLPTFGTIEWQLVDGESGVLLGTFNASGRFSVGIPALCADL